MTDPRKESPEERDQRLALEREVGQIGRRIAKDLPPGVGFTLLLFSFGDDGNLAYISNGDRDDVARVMREWLQRLDRGQT